MDPHNTIIYQNKEGDSFGGYSRNSHPQQSQRQHYLPSYTMPMNNNMSQSLMYNTQNQPMYNIMYTHQSMCRNQNTFTNYPQENWQDSCVKTNSYKEKYESKKDCYIETKNFYNYNKNTILDPQWYYSNFESQKYMELPSCSQITSDNINSCCNRSNKSEKSVKYCSIQKFPDTDIKLPYMKQHDSNIYVSQYDKVNKEFKNCSQLPQTCSLYSGSACLEIDKLSLVQNKILNVSDSFQNDFYPLPDSFIDVSKSLEKSDETGNESDIIVENSDEDSDDSDIDKEAILCLICKTHLENISYDISLDLTVTSSTHTKVSEKLFHILGWITIESQSKKICDLCMSLINTFDNLEMQLESTKQQILEKYQVNGLCLNKETKSNLNIPKKLLKKSKFSFKCKICKKICSFKKFYEYHMCKHKQKRFSCKYCKKIFRTLPLLKFHYNKHKSQSTKNKVKQFICHICGKMFTTQSNLKEHENLCSGNLPFNCLECEKKYPSNNKLQHHIKTTHEKKFVDTCKICGRGFVKKSELKVHMLSHSTEKNHFCNICKKVYKTLSNLNQHKKLHLKTFPFLCEFCHKGFLRKDNLTVHLNNHSENKLFFCLLCDKKFSSQKYLDAHMKIHNENVRMKSCNVCGKLIKNSIEEHLRTHSNLKEFECLKCFMKFFTKGALAKHTKRKHENN